MPVRFRMRGTGMTQRPQIVMSLRDHDTILYFNKTRKFEGWVSDAEQWARAELAKAGHGSKNFDNPNQLQKIAHAADEDSDEDFAARVLKLIINVRAAIKEGNAERAAMDGVRLGQVIADQEYKEECERIWDGGRRSGIGQKKGGEGKRGSTAVRDRELAEEYQRKRMKSRLSDSALKETVGKRTPLGRTASIEAINRGLKLLSALRSKPNR